MEPDTSGVKPYVDKLLELYRHTPGTPGRARRGDRRLAMELYNRNISLSVVQEALLLATARRSLRAPDAAPLSPVRSLHYFVPVIEELLVTPLPDGYADYLQRKLKKIQAEHDKNIAGSPLLKPG